jgi:hypothetical protein
MPLFAGERSSLNKGDLKVCTSLKVLSLRPTRKFLQGADKREKKEFRQWLGVQG